MITDIQLHGLLNTPCPQLPVPPTPPDQTLDWQRPLDWPALDITTYTDGILLLHKSSGDANFVALSAAGDYVVDWGDGTVVNETANSIAEHKYADSVVYHTVKVTPQPTFSLTSFSIGQPNSVVSNNPVNSGWIDMVAKTPELTQLMLGYGSYQVLNNSLQQVTVLASKITNATSMFQNLLAIQSVPEFAFHPNVVGKALAIDVVNGNQTITSVGHQLINGQTVMLDTDSTPFMAGYVMNSQFFTQNVTADTFELTDTYGNMQPIIPVITQTIMCRAGINATQMFNYCSKLVSSPPIDMSNVVTAQALFQGCTSLVQVKPYVWANLMDATSLFDECNSVATLPTQLFTVAKVLTLAFANMPSLNATADVTAPQARLADRMFFNCYSLEHITSLQLGSYITNTNSMFGNCRLLETAPLFNTSAVTNFASMFVDCTNLTHIPAFNMAGATAISALQGMFNSCYSLNSVLLTNISMDISFRSCNLSAAGLNIIFNNLITTPVSLYINAVDNWGYSTADQTIPTTKGWVLGTLGNRGN